jgi:hypothetical protein
MTFKPPKKNRVTISEENVTDVNFEEVKTSEKEDFLNDLKSDEQDNDLDNIFEEVKEAPKKESKNKKNEALEVDLEQLKSEQKNEKVVIDFMNDDFASEQLKKTPKKSDEPIEKSDAKSIFEGKTIQEVKDEIASHEKEKSDKMKPSDYEDVSRVLINIIDWIISAILKWYAKDSSDYAYSLSEDKKRNITNQLTLILVKHGNKWSIEFLFIMTLVAVYSGPAFAAHENRKNPNLRGKGKPSKK